MVYQLKEEDKIITSPKTIFKICSEILKADDEYDQGKEHFWVFQLDVRNKIKLIELVSLGTLNSTIVHPREVFRRAVKENSASIIIAHNHPSGVPDPSEDDLKITARIKQAGKILDIELTDHVVIAKDSYYSFKEKGVLYS